MTNKSASDVSAELSFDVADVHFAKTFPVKAGETVPAEFSYRDIAEMTMNDPALWWPNGYGNHPLYTLTASLTKKGQIIDDQKCVWPGSWNISVKNI